MNRRKSLGLLAGMGTPIISPFLANHQHPSGWLSLFSERWKNCQLYTFEIFDAMPESMLGFQPTADMMSFGKIFSHLGFGLEIYAGVLDGQMEPEEPASIDKSTIFNYLEDSFEYFNRVLEAVRASDLYTKKHPYAGEEPWEDFTISDVILLAYNHTVHHRAQATVYLRLNGIVPPKYRF